VSLAEVDAFRGWEEYFPRGLCLDANLIVLLVVGSVWPDRIATHKRTSALAFTEDDFEVLASCCALFSRKVTLPNVLTEASDFLKTEEEQCVLRALCIETWDEVPIASKQAASAAEYPFLGLADSAVLERFAGQALVLSTDAVLVNQVLARNGAAVNFTWLRGLG
jgi:hypothetical protein